MSLLIKALDHLEKNKQAEKDKKQTGQYVADEALLLELVPVETKEPEVELNAEVAPALGNSVVSVESDNIPLEIAREISLEEEAGLTGASFAANKFAKPKPATKPSNKPALETKPLKTSTQETIQSTSVKNKAGVSTQAPAFQMVNDELNQKAAAKVFVANKEVKVPSSKFALISLGVVGALLVLLGLQGYDYIKGLAAPEVVVLKPSTPIQPQVATVAAVEAPPTNTLTPAQAAVPNQENQSANEENAIESLDNKSGVVAFKNKDVEKSNAFEDVIEAEPKKVSTKDINSKKANKNNDNYVGEDASYAEPRSNKNQKSVTLISKVQSQGVDPTLLAAYQAFTRGEDESAQQQYRQVLQRDVRNVDALLGMAAIAQRQGRDADAQGWYQKVLEIEPRNTIAQTAIVSPQANTDAVGTESRIKNMIAQQPEGASLHAALGNLYAEQSQWPSAQEAYFNASRLAPNNADYAFNLAISLDQMGKPSLALKQYQRALDLLNKSGAASPDRAQLEARIRELQ
jgi:tetratricopeptide (TPR) repeat protein